MNESNTECLYFEIDKKLKYILKTKQGSLKDLSEHIGESSIDKFRSIGFISIGNNQWKKLDLAKRYYIDLFGYTSYFIHIILSSIFRI